MLVVPRTYMDLHNTYNYPITQVAERLEQQRQQRERLARLLPAHTKIVPSEASAVSVAVAGGKTGAAVAKVASWAAKALAKVGLRLNWPSQLMMAVGSGIFSAADSALDVVEEIEPLEPRREWAMQLPFQSIRRGKNQMDWEKAAKDWRQTRATYPTRHELAPFSQANKLYLIDIKNDLGNFPDPWDLQSQAESPLHLRQLMPVPPQDALVRAQLASMVWNRLIVPDVLPTDSDDQIAEKITRPWIIGLVLGYNRNKQEVDGLISEIATRFSLDYMNLLVTWYTPEQLGGRNRLHQVIFESSAAFQYRIHAQLRENQPILNTYFLIAPPVFRLYPRDWQGQLWGPT